MSRIAYAFLGAFLITAFVLQWIGPGLGLGLGLGVMMTAMIVRASVVDVLSIGLGLGLALWTVPRALPANVALSSPHTYTADGFISDLPADRGTSIQYVVAIIDSSTVHRILVTDMRLWPRFDYGDGVRVTGKVEPVDASDGYGTALLAQGIDGTMMRGFIEATGEHRRDTLLAAPLAVRTFLEHRIALLLPEPQSSLLAGLLIGARQSLPQHLSDAFVTTGLSHIVAISGSNITIVITVLTAFLSLFPRGLRLVLTGLLVCAFTLMVGGSASAVRAAVMGILGLFALHAGRRTEPRLLILWTAFLMTLWNPRVLWWDMGFQLSFLAVIGLNELGPLLRVWLRHVPETLGLRDALTATLAAQIVAVPWGAYRFGTLPLISPLSNLLIVPLVPITMLTGFAGLASGLLTVPLGRLLIVPGWMLLSVIIDITLFLSHIPFAALAVGSLSPLIIVCYYALLAGIVWGFHRYRNTPVFLPSQGSVVVSSAT